MKAFQAFAKNINHASLKDIYLTHIESTQSIGLDKVRQKQFKRELDYHINIIERKVKNSTYSFTTYKQKLITKGEGKPPRVISIPTIRDRITLKALSIILSDIYKPHLTMEIPQIKIKAVNTEIRQNKYSKFLKVDVKNFFSSIDHSILFQTLRKRIRKKELLSLIKNAIQTNTENKSSKRNRKVNDIGVPQGLSISNILAEIYVMQFDKVFSNQSDIFYIRYVDDILVFHNHKNEERLFEKISAEFTKLKLSVHKLGSNKKTFSGPMGNRFFFLGYQYNGLITSIDEKSRLKFINSIASTVTNTKYKYQKANSLDKKKQAMKILKWRLNLRITGCVFNGSKRGWMFYYSQMNDLELIFKMDITIAKIIKRISPEPLKVKTLIKTFHEAKRGHFSSRSHIINFDEYSISEKREVLELYLGNHRKLISASDAEISRLFQKRLSQIIAEFEQDISSLS